MNEAKNKACPFCNDRVIKAQALMIKNYPAGYNAMCDNCESTGPYAETPEGALEKWNDMAGGREPNATPNAGDIAGSFQRMVSLLADGIKAAEGAQVIVEAYYEDDYRDPSNSDQYCKLMDWLKDARRQMEQANDGTERLPRE